MRIATAQPADAETLTAIAFAAKRHWGYPESWIQHWREALTITADYIATHPTFVAIAEESIVGFSALEIDADAAWLDHLWVKPAAMGRGVGRALFARAEAVARARGLPRLKIVGDPHAEGFYRHRGASLYGREPAPMEGCERSLPLLEKAL
jgi:GNAT superfamily N-acetyltransferase